MSGYDAEQRTWYGRSLASMAAEVAFIIVVVAILTQFLSTGPAIIASAVIGLLFGLVKVWRLPRQSSSEAP